MPTINEKHILDMQFSRQFGEGDQRQPNMKTREATNSAILELEARKYNIPGKTFQGNINKETCSNCQIRNTKKDKYFYSANTPITRIMYSMP